MFNFLFDGKIGDMLAPVVPGSKLFLAIQHHRNDEVQQLINSSDLNHAESGSCAIHVACRYNNRFALDAILSRGKSICLTFLMNTKTITAFSPHSFRRVNRSSRQFWEHPSTLCLQVWKH
jgi:hypothetical protein